MQSGTHTQSRRIGRRNYMRAMVGGATAVGAGSVGVTLGSSDARALLPAIGAGAALATGAAAGYLMHEVKDLATGSAIDSGAYSELTSSEAHSEVRQDAVEMRATEDTVLTTMDNLLNNAKNASYSDGKYAAIEQMNLGNSLSATKTEAEKAINEYYTVQQKNLIDHFAIQCQKVKNAMVSADSKSNLRYNDFALAEAADGDTDQTLSYSMVSKSATLANGVNYAYDSLQVEWYNSSKSADEFVTFGPFGSGYTLDIFILPVSSGSNQLFFTDREYKNITTKIDNQRTTVISEIKTWIDGVYSSYNAGDIALSDIVSASDIASKAPDEQGYSYAGADLALLGIEGADHKYKIDLKNDEQIVTGTVYAQGRTESLQIGTVYSPGDISGTVWLAYEASDGEGGTVSDLIGLEQDFEILSGIDGNGEEVSEVTFSETNQQTTDTDIQKIQEELQRLQDLEDKFEEQQRQEVTSGGGGGILPEGQLIDGISNKILGAGAAAVAIYGAISS